MTDIIVNFAFALITIIVTVRCTRFVNSVADAINHQAKMKRVTARQHRHREAVKVARQSRRN